MNKSKRRTLIEAFDRRVKMFRIWDKLAKSDRSHGFPSAEAIDIERRESLRWYHGRLGKDGTQ